MMEGVAVHPLKHIVVPKGDIYHALKSTDEGYAGFGEAYFSQIEQGAAKGWKVLSWQNHIALSNYSAQGGH